MSFPTTETHELPTVLDIEASGFGRKSYPIEIGFILPDGQTFCTLIRPEPEWTHWDADAEHLHHISRDILTARGRPVVEVAQLLNEHLRGKVAYSDGWANDYTWLNVLFDMAEMTPRFKLENLRVLLQEAEADRWHDVKKQVIDELGQMRHRASNDARVLQRTVQRVRERAPA